MVHQGRWQATKDQRSTAENQRIGGKSDAAPGAPEHRNPAVRRIQLARREKKAAADFFIF
jgi:hypothetical protein